MALFYITICTLLAIVIFIINRNILYALLIGFVGFLYSLKSLYIYYQEVSKEKICNYNPPAKK